MLVVGVTGSLGTGKSTVAGMFARRGAKVISADAIAHALLRPEGGCSREVLKAFGPGILADRQIDRRKLADIVFKDREALKVLTEIIHPKVRREIQKEIAHLKKTAPRSIVVVDVPLLFEAGLNRQMDVTITVKAGRENQLKRSTKGLGISKAEALRRMKAQMPLRKKIRLADIIIDNNATTTETQKQVKAIWQKLLQKKRR